MQAAYSPGVEQMRPVRLARQIRLQALADRHGGPKALSLLVGSPDTHLIALSKGSKLMGDKLARKIEAALDLPTGWLDVLESDETSPPTSGGQESPQAQRLSLLPFETPPHIKQGELMTMAVERLPARFSAAVWDEALAPQTPKGTVLVFEVAAKPQPGHGVLVQDATGARYVRRYIPGTAGRWVAGSRNDAYPPMDSERDGLTLLAVATGRLDGAV